MVGLLAYKVKAFIIYIKQVHVCVWSLIIRAPLPFCTCAIMLHLHNGSSRPILNHTGHPIYDTGLSGYDVFLFIMESHLGLSTYDGISAIL